MAVRSTTIQLNGNEQVAEFWSENTELTAAYAHLIISDVTNFPLVFRAYQGNETNKLDRDTHEILGDDILVPIARCDDDSAITTITENGSYFIAVDFFFGKYGEFRVEPNTNTSGTVKAIINTVKKH